VEDRWQYHIGVREKVSPENFGIRIRDPAKSDGVQGLLKESSHRCLSHRDIGDPGDKLFVHFGIANRNPDEEYDCGHIRSGRVD
jgi:hypothetical protein